MLELGKKSEVLGVENLRSLEIYGKPTSMPCLKSGENIICGLDQGLGERLFVCDSLSEMLECYEAYYNGYALRIFWYAGDDPGILAFG